jgi:diguanylate cyclase (GGDEF)-like protein
MAETPMELQVRAATEAIWRKSLQQTADQVGALEMAAAAMLEGQLDEATRAQAERQAHRLAGSAGTFGFHRASAIARELELIFERHSTDPAEAVQATALIAALRASLRERTDIVPPAAEEPVDSPTGRHEAESAPRPANRSAPDVPVVVVVADGGTTSTDVLAQVRARGLTARAVDPGAVDVALERDGPLPSLGIVEVPHERGPDRSVVIRKLDDRGIPVLAVVDAAADTFTRVSALRAGARLLIDVPQTDIEWSHLGDTVATLAGSRESARHRILAVDDDETVLAGVREILAQLETADVTTLSDPQRFWPELNRVEPDLLLLDVDMPGVNGLELCRLVRSNPRWQQLPVVFLSARTDPGTVERVYAAGADDFVGKPVVAPELCARIAHRLERTRLHRLLAETDPLTGLANRRRLELDLGRLQRLADRQGTPLCLAVVDLDKFKRVNDTYGHDVGDEVLRRTAAHLQDAFRGEDAVARLGGEEFVVAMLGMRRDDAVQRLSAVLRSLATREMAIDEHRVLVGASAGVAEYRQDGVEFEALYRAADAALRVAKAAGRGMVLSAGVEPPDRRDVDVAIVEDDEVLGELLRHTLTTLGYSCVLLPDGVQAVDRLTGPGRVLRVKTVLLDIDLPGRNGFEVLRALQENGVTAHSSVLVVSARSSQDEALRALRAGATDHIAKPFSVPLLVEKLHRLMADMR